MDMMLDGMTVRSACAKCDMLGGRTWRWDASTSVLHEQNATCLMGMMLDGVTVRRAYAKCDVIDGWT